MIGNNASRSSSIHILGSSNGCPFEVKIRAPKHSGEIEFVAFVLFHDMNAGIHVSNVLKAAAESGAMLEMGPVHHMHPVRFS